MFSTWDWVVVVLYLIGMVTVGLWASRGQRSKRDYFLGARNLPWWMEASPSWQPRRVR